MKPVNYNQVYVSQNLNFNLSQFWHVTVKIPFQTKKCYK